MADRLLVVKVLKEVKAVTVVTAVTALTGAPKPVEEGRGASIKP